MIQIALHSGKWRSLEAGDGLSVWVAGRVFDENGAVLSDEGLVQRLAVANASVEELNRLLAHNNGFYAVVVQDEHHVLACVDRVRSIPLFYSKYERGLYLSDSAEAVRQHAGDVTIDPVARDEFLLTGYVTGRDTLYPNVKQLQAGEYLHYRESSLELLRRRYYRFLHSEPDSVNEVSLAEELALVLDNVMKRLVTHAGGRQIVLPLSGGYDSRLIALLLKEARYADVVCFSYGLVGNKESKYSREFARELGFDWVFCEYSEEVWQREWWSPCAEAYRKTASNHASLPHIQDWLAVKMLVERQKIRPDAVVVPGHTGDFISGSHIPELVFKRKHHSIQKVIESLVADHYSNTPRDRAAALDDDLLESRLLSRIDLPFDGTDIGFADAYELWGWQERQAKYIVNSVRVYDQFGLDWWLPLWDAEFMNFWQRVPLRLREGRKWFTNWIDELQEGVLPEGVDLPTGNAADVSKAVGTLAKVLRHLPAPIVSALKSRYHKHAYVHHPLAFKGLLNSGDFSELSRHGYTMIGMYSKLFIEGNWGG